MTDDNNKLRAVFLAALMVLWVFAGTVAFAGGAAALTNGSIEDGSVAVTANDGTGESGEYNTSFTVQPDDPGNDSVGGVSIVVAEASGDTNGGSVDTSVSTGDVTVFKNNSTRVEVPLEGVATRDTDGDGIRDEVIADFDGPVAPDDGATFELYVEDGINNPEIEGDYEAELRSYEGDNPIGGSFVSTTDTYTISSTDTGADDEDRETDAAFAGGSTRWKGQNLDFVADPACTGSEPVNYQLRYLDKDNADNQGVLIREITLNDSNGAQIPTNDVADNEEVVITAPEPTTGAQQIIEIDGSGEQTGACYNSYGGDDNPDNDAVEVVPQTLDAEFEEDPVRVDDDDNATLVLDSNRNDYDVYVDSDDFSQGELEDVIANGTSDDINTDRSPSDESVIVRNLDSDDNIQFDFEETGNYSFDLSPTDTTASDNASIQVQEEISDDAEFTSDAYTVKRGDIQSPEGDSEATISVDSNDLDFVLIVVGEEDRNNYETAILAEPDSDGNVDIRMNTFLAGVVDDGNESKAYTAINGDIRSVNRRTEKLTGVLDEGQYDLTVQNRGEEQLDAGVLNVQRSSYDELTQYRHPGAPLSAADEPSELANNTNLTESELVTLADRDRSSGDAARDLLVHEANISGVYGVLDAVAQENGYDTLEDAAEDGAGNELLEDVQNLDDTSVPDIDPDNDAFLELSLEQVNFRQNTEPKEETYTDETDPGFNLVVDEDNETLYLVTDVEEVEVEREIANGGTEEGLQITNEEDYEFTFDVGPAYNETFEGGIDTYKPEGETTAPVDIEDREAEFDPQGADETTVNNEANQTLSGQTNVAPGTEIRVAVSDSGDVRRADDNDTDTDRTPIFESNTVEVEAGNSSTENTFSGEFSDFEDTEVGQTFVATAEAAGIEDSAERDGRVVEGTPVSVGISDVTVPADQDELSTITVDSAYLPRGGFITIHDGTLADGATFDSVRGTSEYIEADTEVSDVEVELDDPYTEDGQALAMPHEDTNGNEEYDFVTSEGEEDVPYTDPAEGEDGAYFVGASVTFETPTPTVTATDEPTATATDGPTDTPTPTSSDQPGFGAVLALIALIGAALLAARRNDF